MGGDNHKAALTRQIRTKSKLTYNSVCIVVTSCALNGISLIMAGFYDDYNEDDDEMTLAQVASIQHPTKLKCHQKVTAEKNPSFDEKIENESKLKSKKYTLPIKAVEETEPSKDKTHKKKTKGPTERTVVSILSKYEHNINTFVKYSNATPFLGKNLHGYICAYCRDTISDSFSLRFHTSSRHRNDKLSFDSKYRSDLAMKIDITDLQCEVCRHKFDRIASLKEHLAEKHYVHIYLDINDYVLEFKLTENDRLDCALCNSTFETFKMLLQHMNGHYRNAICDICDLGFINKIKLRNHKRTHEVGRFQCTVCEKVFSSDKKRIFHEKCIHQNHSRYITKCPHCDQSFNNYYSRNSHMITAHKTSAAIYDCNICNRRFVLKAKLTYHIRKYHLLEKNHVCSVCGCGFFCKSRLEEHMIRHRGDQNYHCHVCTKAFARKRTLKYHLNIHSNGEFQCGMCGAIFTTKCGLRDHMSLVHGVSLSDCPSMPHIIIK